MTSVCGVGAGASGGVIRRPRTASGVPVSAPARGRTLAAFPANGPQIRPAGAPTSSPVAGVSDDPAALGVHDVVVLTVKAHALPALAPTLAPLLGPDTLVVAALNGVPWWFFDGLGGQYDGVRLDSVDPGGVIS